MKQFIGYIFTIIAMMVIANGCSEVQNKTQAEIKPMN